MFWKWRFEIVSEVEGESKNGYFGKFLSRKLSIFFSQSVRDFGRKSWYELNVSFPSFGTRRSKSSELPHISIRKTIKGVSPCCLLCNIDFSNFKIEFFHPWISLGENLEEILCIVDKYFTKRIFCLISFCEISLSLIFDNEISVSCPSQLYRTSRWCSVHDYKV